MLAQARHSRARNFANRNSYGYVSHVTCYRSLSWPNQQVPGLESTSNHMPRILLRWYAKLPARELPSLKCVGRHFRVTLEARPSYLTCRTSTTRAWPPRELTMNKEHTNVAANRIFEVPELLLSISVTRPRARPRPVRTWTYNEIWWPSHYVHRAVKDKTVSWSAWSSTEVKTSAVASSWQQG